jgi:hypothetical protein
VIVIGARQSKNRFADRHGRLSALRRNPRKMVENL